MEEYFLLTFESTHAAISTEKLLKPAEVTIMPVPRFISASCGISVRIRPDRREQAETIFTGGSRLTPEDYAYYHISIDKAAGSTQCDRIMMKTGVDADTDPASIPAADQTDKFQSDQKRAVAAQSDQSDADCPEPDRQNLHDDLPERLMVIFDLDGTLWDSAASVAESWNLLIESETGQSRGLTAADISRNMGKTMDQIADDLFSDLPPEERYALARRCEVFENKYITEHGGRLFDGVRETLAGLREAGCATSVVSNCQEGYVKAFIDSMDMAEFFDDYEEWGRSGLLKADNIRLVMERNGISRAVYVGDIQKDSDAAHEAGIPCINAAYGFGDIRDAEATIESFAELPGAIRTLERT